MKALVHNGPRDVSVNRVPDAKIERSTDVRVKITSTNMQPCNILGHENLGTVIDVGEAVDCADLTEPRPLS